MGERDREKKRPVEDAVKEAEKLSKKAEEKLKEPGVEYVVDAFFDPEGEDDEIHLFAKGREGRTYVTREREEGVWVLVDAELDDLVRGMIETNDDILSGVRKGRTPLDISGRKREFIAPGIGKEYHSWGPKSSAFGYRVKTRDTEPSGEVLGMAENERYVRIRLQADVETPHYEVFAHGVPLDESDKVYRKVLEIGKRIEEREG